MGSLLLLTIVIASIWIPFWAAGTPDPREGLRKTARSFVLFGFAYLVALKLIYPRLG